MSKLRQYEKDERQALNQLIQYMNMIHANMGGRDSRPERKALVKCMNILQRENDRKEAEIIALYTAKEV